MHMTKYGLTYLDIDLVQIFIHDLYVVVTSSIFKDIDTTMFYNKIKMYLSEGGLEIRKWETNYSTINVRIHCESFLLEYFVKYSFQWDLMKHDIFS